MGDLNFEEGGNPVQMNRVIVGKDPVLVDAYVAECMGFDKTEIQYILIAEKIGVGSSQLEKANICELNKDSSATRIVRSRTVEKLAKHIEEKNACSAFYGSLIHALGRLDEDGKLGRINKKIKIGQGYKGLDEDRIGVGMCTRGCKVNVSGCPPKAKDIINCIEESMLK